jgi:hypothetical protein
MGEPMRLDELARLIGARVVVAGRAADGTIDRIYAGDRISDLLTHASPTTLILTNLSGNPLVRAAELMDVPALCLVSDRAPLPATMAAAEAHGVCLMVSPVGLFETCGRLHAALGDRERSGP